MQEPSDFTFLFTHMVSSFGIVLKGIVHVLFKDIAVVSITEWEEARLPALESL